jgi:hypothetical protein
MDLENVVLKQLIFQERGGVDWISLTINYLAIYRELEDLQGNIIPSLIAYGILGGILQVIVLQT